MASVPQTMQFNKRIRELMVDGYVGVLSNGQLMLTSKGMSVVLACSERPIKKPDSEAAVKLRKSK
jgi:hypothetical protein